MTKFAKGDVVRVHASKFDGDPDNVDELGLTYSQRMLHDKKGSGVTVGLVWSLQKSPDSHRNTRSNIMREGQWMR